MSEHSRLRLVRDALNFHKQGDFAKAVDLEQGSYSPYETGKRPIPEGLKLLLKDRFNVNLEWFKSGNGAMFLAKAKFENSIPLVSVKALGGKWNSHFAIEEKDIIERYVVPDFKEISFIIEVNGDSMIPNFKSGDRVACRIIKERSVIQWGRAYVISSKENGILIKRLKQSENKHHIKAVSDNPTHGEFDIPERDIDGIALVVGVIRLE